MSEVKTEARRGDESRAGEREPRREHHDPKDNRRGATSDRPHAPPPSRREPRTSGGANDAQHAPPRRPRHDDAYGQSRHLRLPDPANLTAEIPRKSFTARCRLFVGNLPNEMKEEECRKMFAEFGEIGECFMSGKGFGFLRLDTRAHAESAKEALDGKIVLGRQLRVRFATHGAALRVWELSPVVSNEMLYNTFSMFGEVERAVHIVDERGKPTGEGIIEFERKNSAQDALRHIDERVFILTAHSRPLRIEMLENRDEEDGLAERMIQRNAHNMKEREVGPRFADEGSFEQHYGMKWKELYVFEKSRRDELDAELRDRRRRLEADMEIAFDDYQADKLRNELEQRKRELDRIEALQRDRQRQFGRPPIEPGGGGGPPMHFEMSEGPPMHARGRSPWAPPPFDDRGDKDVRDGPYGRHVTHGREPRPNYREERPPREQRPGGEGGGDAGGGGGGGPQAELDMPEVSRFLQAHRHDGSKGDARDVHHANVQRNLTQSLGFGAQHLPPSEHGAPPTGPMFQPPNAFVEPQMGGPQAAFGAFNRHVGGPPTFNAPPLAIYGQPPPLGMALAQTNFPHDPAALSLAPPNFGMPPDPSFGGSPKRMRR